jgi:NitT/TauT family transport system substrate-binding protein
MWLLSEEGTDVTNTNQSQGSRLLGVMAGGIALLVTLSGCGGSSDGDDTSSSSSSAPSSAAQPVDVSVGAVKAISGAALPIGVEQGYFKDQGLNVKITTFQNLGQLAGPLATGQIDVGGGAVGPGIWNAVGRGAAIKVVATQGAVSAGHSYSAVYVKKSSSISKCSDLKGKNIAFAADINAGVHTVDLWLQGCGLSMKDVHMKVMPFSDMPAALSSGSVDVAHMADPAGQIALKQGIAKLLIKDSDVRNTQQGVLEFSPKFVKKSDVANRFMVAYARAIEYYNEHWKTGSGPDAELGKLLVSAGFVKDASVLSNAEPPLLQEFGQMDLNAIKSDYEYFKQKNAIKGDVAFDAAIDTSFSDYAKAHPAE